MKGKKSILIRSCKAGVDLAETRRRAGFGRTKLRTLLASGRDPSYYKGGKRRSPSNRGFRNLSSKKIVGAMGRTKLKRDSDGEAG